MANDAEYWEMIHAERARLAEIMTGFRDDNWRAGTLCSEWMVEHVVAHLTAGANTSQWAWFLSMLRAGFNPGKHNQRWLAQYVGNTHAETLGHYRDSISSTIAPTKDYGAWLGEVIVHSQDIARPLGINLKPDPAAVNEVAHFFAAKDFAVNSKKLVSGLQLDATDSSFRNGSGPIVRGKQLELVMAMAGRPDYSKLTGDGVEELRIRLG